MSDHCEVAVPTVVVPVASGENILAMIPTDAGFDIDDRFDEAVLSLLNLQFYLNLRKSIGISDVSRNIILSKIQRKF